MRNNGSVIGYALEQFISLSGLKARARDSVLNYRIETLGLTLSKWPASFSGFRILHLSDFHIDAIPDRAQRLCELLSMVKADVCVMTGDFQYEDSSDQTLVLNLLRKVLSCIDVEKGIYVVPGNHDHVSLMDRMSEELNLTVLRNEHVFIQVKHLQLCLGGVDDPVRLKRHDVEKTFKEVPSDCPKVLLAHSPHLAQQAHVQQVDLYLCGHSHGGQICLPGGIPVINNCGARDRLRGYWNYKGMHGYTTFGVGCTAYPIRFNARPEVALITIQSPSRHN